MKPHEQRVVGERAELNAKLEKLKAFFGTPIFAGLDQVDQGLLTLQAMVMGHYVEILDARIARFPKA